MNSNKDSQENLKKLNRLTEGKNIDEIITNSSTTISKHEQLIDDLIKMNKENGAKIAQITGWVDQITELFNNLKQHITSHHKNISIKVEIDLFCIISLSS